MNTDTTPYNEATWGETLDAYKRKKSHVPWHGIGEPDIPSYVTNYDVKRKERSYDPIMNQYRDAEKEAEFVSKEKNEESFKLEEALKRKKRIDSRTTNLVTNLPLDGYEYVPTRSEVYYSTMPPVKNTSINWNMLSHYPAEEHVDLSIIPQFKSIPLFLRF